MYKDGIITEEYKDSDELNKDGIIETVDGTIIEGKLDDYIPFLPGKFAEKNETYNDGTNTAIIPEGFKILEDAAIINNGLVIEDKTGNQFVWIPVTDINDMAQCSTAGGDCKLELQWTTLKCTTHNSEEIVGKLYATSDGENFGTVNTTYNANSGLREPAIVTGSSSGSGTMYDGAQENLDILKYSSSSAMLEDLKKKYKEMATSVAKNGGFYIGRYELGVEGTTPVSKNASINANVRTASSANENTKMWWGLYSKCKEFATEESEKSVVSTMIWGSQYDAMLNWMEGKGETVRTGNLNKVNNTTITGNKTNDVIRNIYDLYGCYREWTLEANSYSSRVFRSGFYREEEASSISYRYGYYQPVDTTGLLSTRITLYIK